MSVQGHAFSPGPGVGFSSQRAWSHPADFAAPPPPAVHSYKSMQPEMDRVMEFYETARVDGLIKREETPKTMTEHYRGRSDFLSYRHVDFGDRVKKLALNSAESNPRPMVVSSRWAWRQGAHSLRQAKATLGWGNRTFPKGPVLCYKPDAA